MSSDDEKTARVSALRETMRSGVTGVWRDASRTLYGLQAGIEDGLDRLLVAVNFGNLNELDETAKAAIYSLPSSVVESLIEEDPRHAAEIVEKLEQNGWTPRTASEIAVCHILHRQWDQLDGIGEACIRPLVEVASNDSGCFDDKTRRAAASALESVIGKIHAELPEKTLHDLWNLGDVVRVEEETGGEIKHHIYSWTEMRICIRQDLELRDLVRRGVDAVVERLEQNGWNPRTQIETAIYHIVRREWDQLAIMGEASVVPLAEVVTSNSAHFDDQARREAAIALEAAVEDLCSSLSEPTLRFLLKLENVVRGEKRASLLVKSKKTSTPGQ